MQPKSDGAPRPPGLPEHREEEADEEHSRWVAVRVQHQPQLALGADRRSAGCLAGLVDHGLRGSVAEQRRRIGSRARLLIEAEAGGVAVAVRAGEAGYDEMAKRCQGHDDHHQRGQGQQ